MSTYEQIVAPFPCVFLGNKIERSRTVEMPVLVGVRGFAVSKAPAFLLCGAQKTCRHCGVFPQFGSVLLIKQPVETRRVARLHKLCIFLFCEEAARGASLHCCMIHRFTGRCHVLLLLPLQGRFCRTLKGCKQ